MNDKVPSSNVGARAGQLNRLKAKMKSRQWLGGLAAVAALGTLCWFALISMTLWLRSLDSSVAAALTTAVLGLLGLWYAQWHLKSRDIAESHRTSNIEVYSIFFDIVEKFQNNQVNDNELADGNIPAWLRNDLTRLNRGPILWASPDVITAWLNFRRVTGSGGGGVLLAMDRMYKAIRKDLGNSNIGLKGGDLIRIGLKDPDELKQ